MTQRNWKKMTNFENCSPIFHAFVHSCRISVYIWFEEISLRVSFVEILFYTVKLTFFWMSAYFFPLSNQEMCCKWRWAYFFLTACSIIFVRWLWKHMPLCCPLSYLSTWWVSPTLVIAAVILVSFFNIGRKLFQSGQ